MSDEDVIESAMAEVTEPQPPMDSKSEGDLSSDVSSTEPEGVVTEAFLSLDRDGKQISLDQAKAKAYAQKGFDYETKMHNLRVDRQLFDRERESMDSDFKELKEMNDYAKKNPAWESFVREQWQSRLNNQDQAGNPSFQQQNANPQANQISTLQNQLNNVMSQLSGQQDDLKARKAAELDSRLQGEIDTYKDKYADFDWKTQDELGLNLEGRIQQHAIDNGIKGYTAAARDLLWDEHMKRANINSKEQVGKEVQKQASLGLGKVTKNSQVTAKQAQGVREKSYHDLTAEALAEYGIS